MDEIIKIVAKYFVLIPVAVNLYIFWRLSPKKRLRMALIVIAGGILALVLAKVGSHLYNDPRPQFKDHSIPLFSHSNDNGFPSDHTLLAAFLGYTALIYSRKAGLGLLAVAVIIGWARVAAHVHHLVDIAGSFIVAVIACGIAKYLVNRFYGAERQSK
jgi:membrane-associated phospholipid phosphatase